MEILEWSVGQVHVPLIEDTSEDAMLVRSYLAPHPEVSVEFVDTMAAGEKSLADQTYDLVLLDLFLPDSSGLATLRRLRQGFPTIPVVVLTGLEGQDGLTAARSNGAAAFLTKGSLSAEQPLDSIRSSITT